MTDYTPTTEEVRGHFIYGVDDLSATNTEARTAEFDRWLAAHDAEVREQAAQRVQAMRQPSLARDFNGNPFPSMIELGTAIRAALGEDTK